MSEPACSTTKVPKYAFNQLVSSNERCMNLKVNKASNCKDEFLGGSFTIPEITNGLPNFSKEGSASNSKRFPTTSMLLKNFFAVLSVITTELISLSTSLGLPRKSLKLKTSKKLSSTNKPCSRSDLFSATTSL